MGLFRSSAPTQPADASGYDTGRKASTDSAGSSKSSGFFSRRRASGPNNDAVTADGGNAGSSNSFFGRRNAAGADTTGAADGGNVQGGGVFTKGRLAIAHKKLNHAVESEQIADKALADSRSKVTDARREVGKLEKEAEMERRAAEKKVATVGRFRKRADKLGKY